MISSKKNISPYILAVHDEEIVLMLLKVSLSARGYKVHTLINAKGLWESLITKIPDIIFLDIQMAGVNGDSICMELKSNAATAKIPVVLFSSFHNLEEVAKNCCADGFIRKPFSSDVIVSEINRVLSRAV